MIIDLSKLDYLVERLKKKGVSEPEARKAVYGFFNAAIEVLEEGEELPLLGSEFWYKKSRKNYSYLS
ncbi:MAG: hypothetical protein DRN25_04720 [Thermoplasmata archaeon]|nr:MAG: hypothetical protein DRN25_04720 [Thermoplasmata archaeon]